ncbi:hypothetical protein GC173_13455 [bacterium]|nr:hypothetical protein [bacterium]
MERVIGFFDRLMGGGKIELTPKSALALAAMTMMSADGVVDDSELMDLQKIVRGDRKAFDQAMKGYKTKKVEEVIPIVAENLNQQQRLATIAILLDLAMGDGHLADDERQLLQAYSEAFELSEADVTEIIDVIAIKNNFSIFES